MNDEVIITCAVTGAGDTAGTHPELPVTPRQIAEAAVAAARAGAAVAHIHVRDPKTGAPSRKLEYYREGGSEKHLRDIRSMLDASPELIDRTILEKLITERGLAEPWRKAQAHRG